MAADQDHSQWQLALVCLLVAGVGCAGVDLVSVPVCTHVYVEWDVFCAMELFMSRLWWCRAAPDVYLC